jgi:hypothetical protein
MDGWKIVRAEDSECLPWNGPAGEARAKTLGTADGWVTSCAHAHVPPVQLRRGRLGTQRGSTAVRGRRLRRGRRFEPDDFATDTDAAYIVIFRI